MLIQIAFQGVIAARLVIRELHAYAELVLATGRTATTRPKRPSLFWFSAMSGRMTRTLISTSWAALVSAPWGVMPLHSGSVAEYLQARQGNVSRYGRDAAAILADYPDRVLGLDAVERSFFF